MYKIKNTRLISESRISIYTKYFIVPYVSSSTTLREFQEEVIRQKRIEFWGEGIVFWDYKRLELRVERGYKGTNAPKGYRFNSIEGYCAPWMNIYISTYEELYNEAIIINPDPTLAIPEWEATE